MLPTRPPCPPDSANSSANPSPSCATTPPLALPVLFADLLTFAANHLQHALHQPLFNLILGSSSVLNPTRTYQPDPADIMKAGLLATPLVWAAYFCGMLCYSAALLATSARVSRINQPEDSRPPGLTQNRGRLLPFARIATLFLIPAILATVLLFTLEQNIPWMAARMGRNLGYLNALLMGIGLAFILVPRALKLLRPHDAPSPQSRQLGISFAVIALIVQTILILLLNRVLPDLGFAPTTIPGVLLFQAAISQIGATVYVPLFVALSLLTQPEAPLLESFPADHP